MNAIWHRDLAMPAIGAALAFGFGIALAFTDDVTFGVAAFGALIATSASLRLSDMARAS